MKKAIRIRQSAIFLVIICACCLVFAGKSFPQDNLETLADQINRGNSEQKRNALFQIRNLKTEEASRIAVPALSDNQEIVRASAAFSVIFLPSGEAVQVLLPLLRDKKPFVRKETAYALGKTKNPAAIRPLIEIIQKDKIQEVKDAATVSLGEIGDVSAIDTLSQILKRKLKKEEEFMRRAAARSLGEIANNQVLNRLLQRKNPYNSLPDFANELRANLSKEVPSFQNAVKLLIQTLQNQKESDDVKREAAYALGEIGDISAIPILRANLNAEDYYLIEICKESLQKLQPYSG